MTNKELNSQIKKELKNAGYNTRDFKVSVKDCGYSTSIHVTIKNPEINRVEIENILKHHEIIDYDHRTYEILAGANDYLFVDYASGIFDEPAVTEWSVTATDILKNSTDETTRLFDGLYLINWKREGKLELMQQTKDFHGRRCIYNLKDLCIYLYKFAHFKTISL